MVEACEHASLSLEPLPFLLTFKELSRQYLQGDSPVDAYVRRAVDLSHPARAEQGDDFVRTELRAVCERHR